MATMEADGRTFWDENKALLSHKLMVDKWEKEKKLNKYWRENAKHRDTSNLYENPATSIIKMDKFGGKHINSIVYKHPNFNLLRRAIQHDIIDVFVDTPTCTHDSRPWIIFVGGASCLGKSFLIQQFLKHDLIPEASERVCVIDNFDLIRPLIPEWELYLDDAEKADLYNLLYTEVAYLFSCIMWRGLDKGKHILVDGTMKSYDAHKRIIEIIKKSYACYRIGFVFVEPKDFSEKRIQQRLNQRFKVTGRQTSLETVKESYMRSKQAYLRLMKEYEVDFAMRLINYGEEHDVYETDVIFEHIELACKLKDLVEWKKREGNEGKSVLDGIDGKELSQQVEE